MNRIIQMQRKNKKPSMSYFASRIKQIADSNNENYYSIRVEQTESGGIAFITFHAYINNFGIWAKGETIDEVCKQLLDVKRPAAKSKISDVVIDSVDDLPF